MALFESYNAMGRGTLTLVGTKPELIEPKMSEVLKNQTLEMGQNIYEVAFEFSGQYDFTRICRFYQKWRSCWIMAWNKNSNKTLENVIHV